MLGKTVPERNTKLSRLYSWNQYRPNNTVTPMVLNWTL